MKPLMRRARADEHVRTAIDHYLEEEAIEIWCVLHGSRDIPAWLRSEE
jgi:plasmid stabilization system protein ParE